MINCAKFNHDRSRGFGLEDVHVSFESEVVVNIAALTVIIYIQLTTYQITHSLVTNSIESHQNMSFSAILLPTCGEFAATTLITFIVR